MLGWAWWSNAGATPGPPWLPPLARREPASNSAAMVVVFYSFPSFSVAVRTGSTSGASAVELDKQNMSFEVAMSTL